MLINFWRIQPEQILNDFRSELLHPLFPPFSDHRQYPRSFWTAFLSFFFFLSLTFFHIRILSFMKCFLLVENFLSFFFFFYFSSQSSMFIETSTSLIILRSYGYLYLFFSSKRINNAKSEKEKRKKQKRKKKKTEK